MKSFGRIDEGPWLRVKSVGADAAESSSRRALVLFCVLGLVTRKAENAGSQWVCEKKESGKSRFLQLVCTEPPSFAHSKMIFFDMTST